MFRNSFETRAKPVSIPTFFNSEVSKPKMKPGDNVSKPIMKLKHNMSYIYIPTSRSSSVNGYNYRPVDARIMCEFNLPINSPTF